MSDNFEHMYKHKTVIHFYKRNLNILSTIIELNAIFYTSTFSNIYFFFVKYNF